MNLDREEGRLGQRSERREGTLAGAVAVEMIVGAGAASEIGVVPSAAWVLNRATVALNASPGIPSRSASAARSSASTIQPGSGSPGPTVSIG